MVQLSAQNFLFASKDPGADIKLIDLGIAERIRPHGQELTKISGTPPYMAPEMFDGNFNKACDAWSLGCIVFELLFGFQPFLVNLGSSRDLFLRIRAGLQNETKSGRGPWFPTGANVSPEAKDFIAQLLSRDIAARPTMEEALQHKWLRSVVSDEPLNGAVVQSLREYQKGSRFQQAVARFMANDFSDELTEMIKEKFRRLDHDGNGNVDLAEFEAAIKGMPHLRPDMDVPALLKQLDIDGNGTISEQEWMTFVAHRRLSAKDERLYQVFQKIDLNKDGKLSRDELKSGTQCPHPFHRSHTSTVTASFCVMNTCMCFRSTAIRRR